MKIFVVSDTHGSIEDFLREIETMKKPDLIIHLGDYVDDGLKIEKIMGIRTIIVKGNGDYFHRDYDEDKLIALNDKKIFITHGHNYNVRYGVDNLSYKGQEVEADLILFGHTHIPIIIEDKGRIIMNPGSPTQPRNYDGKKTFGIIEIGEKILGEIVEIK